MSTPDAPTAQLCLRVARTAAALAVTAADQAMTAACRSRSANTARLDEAMHAAHLEACDAEKYAEWTASAQGEDVPGYVLANYATSAIDAATRAQAAAGVELTAPALRAELARPLTAQEHADRENARRREEAQREADERAETGMDAENRDLAAKNRFYAKQTVPALGWAAGHLRVMEAAESDRLYWREGQARQARRAGQWEGGRKVSRERTQALYAAQFLTARRDGAARVLDLSPMGRAALDLARLHPAGLHETDRAAYEARHARIPRRGRSSDQRKAAARRLPALDSGALRFYRRPVTLAEQAARARQEAADRWEDEGGYCPGVQTPVPPARSHTAPVPQAPAGPRQAPAAPPVIRRPQRKLTPQEVDVVRRTANLNLQGALLLGIVDPVPNRSPMPEAEGEWVREHAWPDHMRMIDRKYPWGFHRWSHCERGTCRNCLAGRCDLCVHRQKGGPTVDADTDWVHGLGGTVVARLILRPGGEPCLWWCRCPCPKHAPPAGPPAARPDTVVTDRPAARPDKPPQRKREQLALF